MHRMPSYSDKFLQTQIDRSIAIHYDAPPGARRKSTVKSGLFMGMEDGMMLVRVYGEEYPIRIEWGADQPAYASHDRWGDSRYFSNRSTSAGGRSSPGLCHRSSAKTPARPAPKSRPVAPEVISRSLPEGTLPFGPHWV
jgi:hypothetical protein